MISITLFNSERDNLPKPQTSSWQELADLLSEFRPAACRLATCGTGEFDYDGRGNCASKYGAAWSPASYPPKATRSKRLVQSVSLLVLDFDHLTENVVYAVQDALEPYQYLLHSSHSHGKNGQAAIRVVLALSKPIPGNLWSDFWRKAIAYLGVTEWVDQTPKDPSRLYFLPCTPQDGDPLFDDHKGKPLDVDAVIGADDSTPTTNPVLGPVLAPVDTKPATPQELATALESILSRGPAISGVAESRDTKTFAIAAHLVNDWGLTLAEAWPLINEWNKTCQPPSDPQVLKEKLDHANAYASGSRGQARAEYKTEQTDLQVFEMLGIADTLALPESGETLTTQQKYQIEVTRAQREIDIAFGAATSVDTETPYFEPGLNLIDGKEEPTKWLVRGLITDGGLAGIISEPKSTKSWMAMDICTAVATGSYALGAFKAPLARDVLYFFAEEARSAIGNRIKALAKGRGVDVRNILKRFHFQPRGKPVDLSQDKYVARFIASCRLLSANIGLIVLDPLRDIHTGSENDSDSMALVVKRLRYISYTLNCTVLVVHHSKKSSPDHPDVNGSNIRGSSVLNGAFDSRLIMSDLKGDLRVNFENTLEVTVKAGAGAGKQKLLLSIEDDIDLGQAVCAKWQCQNTQTVKDRKASYDEADAYALINTLYTLEARKLTYPGYRALHKELSSQKANFKVGREKALDNEWVHLAGGHLLLTELGREQARASLEMRPGSVSLLAE